MDAAQIPVRKRAERFWQADFPVRPARFPFFYGWVIVALSTAGIGLSMPGQTIGVSVFTTRLMAAFGLSSMQLSVAYMIGTLMSAVLLNSGGRLFDRVGARKASVGSLAAFGCVLIWLGFMDHMVPLVALLPGLDVRAWLPAFLVLSLGFALLRFTGQGMLTLTSRAMMGKWFDRRRGTVTAWSGALVSFMFSGAPIGFEFLIRTFSWQGAWQVMGASVLGVFVWVFWIFARDNPEECGLEMDGGYVGKLRATNPDALIYRDYTLSEARRTFSFWAFTLMFALNGLAITAYAFHVLAIGAELGVSSNYILGLFIPWAGVSIVVGFVIAWLTDQSFMRIKYLLVTMAVSSLLGYAALAGGDYPRIGWLQIVGFGIAGGCFGSLSSIVWPRFFGRRHLGEISGLFMTAIVVASAVGPFLFSFAESVFGAYRAGFAFTAVCAGIIAIAALWADNPQRKDVS
jgi:OFA family oxalate/formate antiporter-like MFS transporter